MILFDCELKLEIETVWERVFRFLGRKLKMDWEEGKNKLPYGRERGLKRKMKMN
jgi:hypothetical protein